ncbi:DinB family protein [Aquimarina algiphila]|uniref:DinB family protein n=1 Tax=Aquimarina algiphila TaxID=2047982 RepID=UPI002493C1FF|nr:DinB family protein [Aquimarina algiphila]
MILLPSKEYDIHIGMLVSQMNHTRDVTLRIVKNLTPKELDFYVDDKSNSIGMLLFHIAGSEFYYQRPLFYDRLINAQEEERHKDAAPEYMNTRKIHSNDLEYYLSELYEVRQHTLENLKYYDDNWVFTRNQHIPILNNYYMIKHFVDDEISHLGQIKWIMKRCQI